MNINLKNNIDSELGGNVPIEIFNENLLNISLTVLTVLVFELKF